MTMMGLDIETIEHLDFDFAPPCEQAQDCDYEAEWKVTPSCCGRLIFFCTPCKEELVAGIKRNPRIADTVCGNDNATVLFIEPLDKT